MIAVAKKVNLIFDFDGTLADSFYAAVRHLNCLAEELHFRKINPHDVEQLKNLTSVEWVNYLNIPFYKLPRILHKARQAMHQEIPMLPSFPLLLEILKELYQSGCHLSILTSNSLENVTSWLERQQIRDLFSFIYAGSSYFGKKYQLKKIVHSEKLSLSETFYIGDETRDIEAAHHSRIQSIAVAWGFNSPNTLLTYKPNYLANSPQALATIIKKYLGIIIN